MANGTGTTEDVRRSNLSATLGILYRTGPVSRAALSKRTGRNRSTIASLVTDLVDLGLVEERDPDSLGQVGRPSPVVTIRPEVTAIAVNPEIDVLTIGLVGLDGQVRRVIRHEYDRIPTATEVISITAAVISGMQVELDSLVVAGIGVAVPGQVRTDDGVVRNAPHLGWRDEPLAEPLAAATGYPVQVANDAALGALAEHEFGAGRGKDHLIYLNGGASGIGGGVISAGVPLGGASGYAGEFGHVRVSSSGLLDSAGIEGHARGRGDTGRAARGPWPDEGGTGPVRGSAAGGPVRARGSGRRPATRAPGHGPCRRDQPAQPPGGGPWRLPRSPARLRSRTTHAGRRSVDPRARRWRACASPLPSSEPTC